MDDVIERLVQHHGARRAEVIPILSELNETFGYIPVEALGKIRRVINAPEEGLFLADSHLFATASFYSMFSLKPVGKHVIRFCESAPCHVVGAREVIEAIQGSFGNWGWRNNRRQRVDSADHQLHRPVQCGSRDFGGRSTLRQPHA